MRQIPHCTPYTELILWSTMGSSGTVPHTRVALENGKASGLAVDEEKEMGRGKKNQGPILKLSARRCNTWANILVDLSTGQNMSCPCCDFHQPAAFLLQYVCFRSFHPSFLPLWFLGFFFLGWAGATVARYDAVADFKQLFIDQLQYLGRCGT